MKLLKLSMSPCTSKEPFVSRHAFVSYVMPPDLIVAAPSREFVSVSQSPEAELSKLEGKFDSRAMYSLLTVVCG